MNATKYGGFAETILPAARKKNMGVIAMKVMRDIVGEAATPRELLEYAPPQEGVASATIGHWSIETLQENIRIAREYVETPVAQLAVKSWRTGWHLTPDRMPFAGPGPVTGMGQLW